jgi:hypothetical protein
MNVAGMYPRSRSSKRIKLDFVGKIILALARRARTYSSRRTFLVLISIP